jgi:hypothetical protein
MLRCWVGGWLNRGTRRRGWIEILLKGAGSRAAMCIICGVWRRRRWRLVITSAWGVSRHIITARGPVAVHTKPALDSTRALISLDETRAAPAAPRKSMIGGRNLQIRRGALFCQSLRCSRSAASELINKSAKTLRWHCRIKGWSGSFVVELTHWQRHTRGGFHLRMAKCLKTLQEMTRNVAWVQQYHLTGLKIYQEEKRCFWDYRAMVFTHKVTNIIIDMWLHTLLICAVCENFTIVFCAKFCRNICAIFT